MGVRVHDALTSECLPVMGRIRSYLRPKRGLNFGGCLNVRTFMESSYGELSNDGRKTGASPSHYETKAVD